MLVRESRRTTRSGVAAVEFACCLPLLLTVLIGVWEMGRIIQVQQILNQAARDAARLAAQANLVNADGSFTQIAYNTGTPNIVDTVKDYLNGAGITNQAGLVVDCVFTQPSVSPSNVDPYTGTKNQAIRVKVTLPYQNVRLSTLTIVNPTTLSGECDWQCLVDNPFTVNTTLPTWSAVP